MSYTREIVDTWVCDEPGCSAVVRDARFHCPGSPDMIAAPAPTGWVAITVYRTFYGDTEHYCSAHAGRKVSR